MKSPRFVSWLGQRMAASDWVARVAPRFVPPFDRFLSRITRGRFVSSSLATTSLVLITTGARTGRPRRSPMVAVPLDGDLYVVGSNFGGEHHPAWSYNLIAHPDATTTMEGRNTPVTAELLDDEDKARVWPQLVEEWPPYARYAERTERDLRVFRLDRRT